MKTYIIGRSKEKTEDACKEIGPNAIPVIYDLNNLAGIPFMIENISKQNQIDILVNNAGINLKKEFLDVTDEDFL
ncbi:SDR family NAD(P)-dependent oxidoreductase [Flavobacterium salmonis]|uniref:SDR family NAD(P)-dependent oxidoreductase n=1 Tax=Flavobacterium salmonis TaxID=2654844 RepID=UPI00293BF37A|nr:SDR family NAD(P)-dependent oxidoreductase [Flavobacterium salmonis]